jgi:hypothetical protein
MMSIETVSTLLINNRISQATQLKNYVFGSEEAVFDMISFGAGSLYNHQQVHSVQHYWYDSFVKLSSSERDCPYSNFTKTLFKAVRPIEAGEELYVYYGDDWFDRFANSSSNASEYMHGGNDGVVGDSDSYHYDEDSYTEHYDGYNDGYNVTDYYRDENYGDYQDNMESYADESEGYSDQYSNFSSVDGNGQQYAFAVDVVEAQDMRRFGHCLSHVHVAASTVEHAGSGLFAGKPFVKGDVVVVSPVLTLPKSIIDSEEGVLRNYCFASRESSMVLFPLNNGAMINHNSAGSANVRIDWYSWLEAYRAISSKYHSRQEEGIDSKSGVFDLAHLLALSVEELFGYSFAALDLSFIATRDIAADEEIFLDYGSEWMHAWTRYQQELSVFRSSSASQCSCSDGDASFSPSDQCQALGDAPVFKHYIAVPEGFYPQHW